MTNTTAENAIPFHEDRSEVHCKNFMAPKTIAHTQATTTCLLTKTSYQIGTLLFLSQYLIFLNIWIYTFIYECMMGTKSISVIVLFVYLV